MPKLAGHLVGILLAASPTAACVEHVSLPLAPEAPALTGEVSCGVGGTNPGLVDPCADDPVLTILATLDVTRTPGPPNTGSVEVVVPQAGIVCVVAETEGVSAAWVDFAGERIMTPPDFGPASTRVARAVARAAGSVLLEARLAGMPGGSLHLTARFRPLEAGDVAAGIATIAAAASIDFAARLPTIDPVLFAEIEANGADIGTPAGAATITMSRWGALHSLHGLLFRVPVAAVASGAATTPEQAALAFLAENAAAFGLADVAAETVLLGSKPALDGGAYVLFGQLVSGISAPENQVVVHVDADLAVRSALGHFLPGCSAPPAAVVSEAEALTVASAEVASEGVVSAEAIALGVIDPTIAVLTTDPVLAWKVVVETTVPDLWHVYIDAVSGVVVGRHSAKNADFTFEVFSAGGNPAEPCSVIPSTCIAADDALACENTVSCPFAGFPAESDAERLLISGTFTWIYFFLRLGRDGWNDDPTTLDHPLVLNADYRPPASASASCPDPELTAQWHVLERHADFSQGFVCLDVVGHELTHGALNDLGIVTSDASGRSGMREGLADAFGVLNERFNFGTTDWLIGTGEGCDPDCFFEYAPGPDAIRSLSDPPSVCDPRFASEPTRNPDHYANYLNLPVGGDEHYNAGILDKVVYLAGREPGEGFVEHSGLDVRGVGEEAASRILYESLGGLVSGSLLSDLRGPFLESAFTFLTVPDSPIDLLGFVAASRAFDAVGLWSAAVVPTCPSPPCIVTDEAPSVVTGVPAPGGDETWMIYRAPGAGATEILLTRRPCSLWLSCAQTTTSLGVSSAEGPAAVLFDGFVQVLFPDAATSEPRILGITPGGLIVPSFIVPSSVPADGAIAAVVVPTPTAEELNILYKSGSGASTLVWQNEPSGFGAWSSPEFSPFTTDLPPAVSAGNIPSQVWVAYRNDSGVIAVRSLFTVLGGIWSPDEFVHDSFYNTLDRPFLTDVRPAVALHDGMLFVAGLAGTAINHAVWLLPGAFTDSWTRNVQLDGAGAAWVYLHSVGAVEPRAYLWFAATAAGDAVYISRRGTAPPAEAPCPPGVQ